MKKLLLLIAITSFSYVAQAQTTTDTTEVEFKSVQVQAKYPGDWRTYLMQNLKASTPTDNGARAGRYSVTVSFLVDKKGNVSEVNAENDPGFGTAKEAVRVIKMSGKWTPATQNGKPVIYRQRQNIVFVVTNE